MTREKNVSSDIQSILDDVSTALSVASDVHHEENYFEDESDSDKSDSIYELSIRTLVV